MRHFLGRLFNCSTYDANSGEPILINTCDGLNRRIIEDIEDTVPYGYYHNTAWQVLEEHADGDTTNACAKYVRSPRCVDTPICL